jgi:hypothetical protein
MMELIRKEETIVLGRGKRLMIVPRIKRTTGGREKRRTDRGLSMKVHWFFRKKKGEELVEVDGL